MFNLSRERCIERVSLKGQCAKDYFYGHDGRLEEAFGQAEGLYGALIKKLIANGSLNENELQALQFFAYLQYSRTEFAAKRQKAALLDFEALIFERNPTQSFNLDLSDETIIRQSLRMFSETFFYLRDLKNCIVRNRTDDDFITSDDPAVFSNKFFSQRLGITNGNFGLINAGIMLSMPLDPKHLLLSYDNKIYHAPNISGGVIETSKTSDVVALNSLQVLNANENIYFKDWERRDYIERLYKRDDRPQKRHDIHFAAKVGEDEAGERYKVLRSKKDRLHVSQALIALETNHPTPSIWFSGLKTRNKPRFVNTESAIGVVRKEAYELDREVRRRTGRD